MKIQSAHFLPGANKRLGDKYLLLECLGDGSHGWVWRSERLSDSAIVAVKIPKQLTKEDRSLAEGKELIGIADHSNIIKIFDMGRVPPEKEWFAIEMEYFPSESLAQKLEHRSHHFGNTCERLFNIYAQVLEAVDYLSCLETPVSHGDIKPHNVLVGQEDLVKLTDFGSSALPEEIYVRTRENGGTVLYAAPEYSDCVSRKGDFPSLLAGDIYSLGVLLYQLTTGRLPHDTQAQVRSHAPFPKPREINSGISEQLETVILCCLEKEQKRRFKSIQALKLAFQKARETQAKYPSVSSLLSPGKMSSDWSTDVVAALENADYQKASKIAAAEYQRSGDTGALLHQFNAMYRAKRWFDFSNTLNRAGDLIFSDSPDCAVIRLLSIKVLMQLRKLDDAMKIVDFAFEAGEASFDHKLCRASITGMRAQFDQARSALEDMNRTYPRNPHILRRIIQVCEQQRDYKAAAGFLRVALKVSPDDEPLLEKRTRYEMLETY